MKMREDDDSVIEQSENDVAISLGPVQKFGIMATCIFMQALVIGVYLYSFTLWVLPWSTGFSSSPASIMLVPTIYLYANSFIFFFFGRYLDILPRRVVVILGLLCFSLSMFLISISPNLLIIYLVYLVIVPISVLFAGPAAAITLVSQIFTKRRGLAIGVVGLGTSLGGMIMPHFAAFAIEDWGWRSANQALAVFGLVLIPIAFFGLGPTSKRTMVKKVQGKSVQESARVFFGQSAFWICILASTGAFFVFMAVQLNMAPVAIEQGFATDEAAFTISLFTAGMLLGKLCTGFLSDRIDPRLVFLGIGALMALALLLMSLQMGEITLLAAFIMFGIGAGGVIPLKAILLAGLFGPKQLGRVMGLAAPFVTLYSLGPVFAAYLWGLSGSYGPVFYVLIAILGLTVPLILLLPRIASAPETLGK